MQIPFCDYFEEPHFLRKSFASSWTTKVQKRTKVITIGTFSSCKTTETWKLLFFSMSKVALIFARFCAFWPLKGQLQLQDLFILGKKPETFTGFQVISFCIWLWESRKNGFVMLESVFPWENDTQKHLVQLSGWHTSG